MAKVTLPGNRIHKIIPKPFNRPAVDITKAKRVWQDIEACDIVEGDTVPEIGVVTDIVSDVDTVVYGGEDNSKVYSPHEIVRVFH